MFQAEFVVKKLFLTSAGFLFFFPLVQLAIRDKSLGTLAHFCSICKTNLPVRPPSPQFNVVYRDKFVIAGFQHCQGERGFPFPNSLSTHFYAI